jgi:hypothetical protein
MTVSWALAVFLCADLARKQRSQNWFSLWVLFAGWTGIDCEGIGLASSFRWRDWVVLPITTRVAEKECLDKPVVGIATDKLRCRLFGMVPLSINTGGTSSMSFSYNITLHVIFQTSITIHSRSTFIH